MKEKLRVAAYCRVSTDHKDQANSLESQIKYFTEYIERNPDMTLTEVYHDDGISGTCVENRDSFNRMIYDAEHGNIDYIITKEVSRFARNTVLALQYVRRLKESNVGVLFMNDNIYTLSQEGEFRLTIMASISQEESRKTSERVKWGHQRRMESGVVFGRDLLGYSVKDGKLYIKPDEAEIVRLIFHMYLEEGKGNYTIAKELREKGIYGGRITNWTATRIRSILTNEKYVGDLCQKKTITPDFLTHKKKYNKGEEEMVFISNHHEPIVDRSTWDRTKEEMARRSRRLDNDSRYSNRHWCSSKLICGECGHRFVSRVKTLSDGGKYRSWRCFIAATEGKKKLDSSGQKMGCDNESIPDRVLLAGVEFVLRNIQLDKDRIISEIVSDIKKLNTMEIDTDTQKIQAEIDSFEKKKIKLIDSLMDNLITQNEMITQKSYYDEKICDLTMRLSEAERANREMKKNAEELQEKISEIKSLLEFTDLNEDICHEVLEQIVIYSGHILEVHIKALPFPVYLTYTSSGKKDKYRLDFEFLEDFNSKIPPDWN